MSNATMDDRLIKEAFRLSELNLQSECNLALASDQRSATFCGIIIASVAILSSIYQKDGADVSIESTISLILFGLAAATAALSARSTKIFVTGLHFESFAEDIDNHRKYLVVISELAKHYDDCSKKNRKLLKNNGRLFNASLFLAFLGFAFAIWPSIVRIECSLFS